MSETFPDSREFHIYPGYFQLDENKKYKQIGHDLLAGDINHLSHTHGRGWKLYPNHPFTWN